MGSGDDRTFKVNFSAAGVEKLRERVRDKLKEFMGDYTDDTLVEYVIVLLRNGRHKEEAKSELNVFLGDDSDSFVSWLWDHLTSHLGLYVQNLVENRGLAPKVRSIIADLPGGTHVHGRDEHHERSGEADNVSKEQRKRDWKGSVRDSTELSSRRGQELSVTNLEEKGHHLVTQGQELSLEQMKKRRLDDSVLRKRDSAQPIIDAPRRLLQFAVRDAVENCRQTGVVKDPPKAMPCIRSVVSTSNESPPLVEQQPRKIHSIAHVLPGMSTVLRAVQEAAEDVKTVRPRRSVFDRLGRGTDATAIGHQVTRSRYEDDDGPLGQFNQIQDQLLKPSYTPDEEQAHGMIADDTGLSFVSTSDSEGDDDVNNRHIRVSNVSRTQKHAGYDHRKTVVSSPNGFNIVNEDTRMARNDGASIPSNSVKLVNDSLNSSTWPSMKYVRPRESGEMIAKQNAQKLNSKVESGLHMSETAIESPASKCGNDVENGSQKLVASNTGAPASRPLEDVDSRTIFVTNVNFSATKDSLSRHFNKFGEVLKVNILTDATTRQPIGSAYVEFMRKEAADNALTLDGSIFLARKLRVLKKSSALQEATPNTTWPRLPARGSSYATGRFPRISFPRGSPARYRSPLKLGMRSFQWKRGDAQSTLSDMGPLSQTSRSLTYIRSESKPDGNLGT